MADIALTTAQVRAINPDNAEFFNCLAAVALTKGDIVYFNTSGKADLADGSAAGTANARGVVMDDVGVDAVVSILKRGLCAGFTVSSLNADVQVFISDTARKLADAAGTVTVPAGRVQIMLDNPDLTKVIYFDFDWLTAYA